MLRPIGSRLSSLAIGFILYLSASGNGAVFAQSDANGVRLIQLQFVATKVRSLLDKSVVVVSSDRDTKVQRRASQGDNVFWTIPLDHSVSDISISKGQHFICFAGPRDAKSSSDLTADQNAGVGRRTIVSRVNLDNGWFPKWKSTLAPVSQRSHSARKVNCTLASLILRKYTQLMRNPLRKARNRARRSPLPRCWRMIQNGLACRI